jgi:hypothetical protein
MNAQLNPPKLDLTLPLPSLQTRRHQLGDLRLHDDAMAGFNALLAHLDANAPSVSADQLSTLARWLQQQPRHDAIALLSERLTRAEHLRRMLQDDDWELDEDLRARAQQLLSYLRQVDDLIHDDLPLLGQLDDALLVELTWPAFSGESQDYLDFCRFRTVERPGGNARDRRLAWQNACLAQAALAQQRRQVRSRHYAGGQPLQPLFRVL